MDHTSSLSLRDGPPPQQRFPRIHEAEAAEDKTADPQETTSRQDTTDEEEEESLSALFQGNGVLSGTGHKQPTHENRGTGARRKRSGIERKENHTKTAAAAYHDHRRRHQQTSKPDSDITNKRDPRTDPTTFQKQQPKHKYTRHDEGGKDSNNDRIQGPEQRQAGTTERHRDDVHTHEGRDWRKRSDQVHILRARVQHRRANTRVPEKEGRMDEHRHGDDAKRITARNRERQIDIRQRREGSTSSICGGQERDGRKIKRQVLERHTGDTASDTGGGDQEDARVGGGISEEGTAKHTTSDRRGGNRVQAAYGPANCLDTTMKQSKAQRLHLDRLRRRLDHQHPAELRQVRYTIDGHTTKLTNVMATPETAPSSGEYT